MAESITSEKWTNLPMVKAILEPIILCITCSTRFKDTILVSYHFVCYLTYKVIAGPF